MHGISQAEWIAYIDGGMAAPDRACIDAHLQQCADCLRIAEELSMSDRVLAEQADRFLRGLELAPADAARIVSAGMDRIRSAPEAIGMEARLGELRSDLNRICGSAIGDISMKKAAYDAANLSVDALTELHWEGFVSHLSAHVASLCGCAVGSLIARTGGQLGMEAVA